jgi:hypothetical protein
MIAAIRFDIGFLSTEKERAVTCVHIPLSHGKNRPTWPAGLDPNQADAQTSLMSRPGQERFRGLMVPSPG